MNVYDLNIRQLIALAEEIRSGKNAPARVANTLTEVVRKYRPKSMKVITQDLSSQITDANIDTNLKKSPGSFLFYIHSTNATDRVNIRFGSTKDNDILPFQPGNLLIGFPFDALAIGVPTAIASATATFLVADVSPDEMVVAL